jgi:hypothetical protein
MQERQRERTARGPARGGGFWDGEPDDGGTATVSHGPYAEELPVAGLEVGQIRERFHDRFDIDPVSQAYVNGSPVADDTVLRTGQLLVFMRPAGEKGS